MGPLTTCSPASSRWNAQPAGIVGAARHLKTLQAEGLIGHVGVTDVTAAELQALVAAGVPPATVQAQYSLIDRRIEAHVLPICTEHGLRVISYNTLAGGFLSDDWLHQPEPKVLDIRRARNTTC